MTAYLCIGVALFTLLAGGVVAWVLVIQWLFGSGEGKPRL